MKNYYICAALFFFTAYAIFHSEFRTSGAQQLYRINDELVFEVQPEDENYNGLSIHGFKPTNKIIAFLCGACQTDDDEVFLANAKYQKGDYVFTDFPQHEQATTDIVNLRTGETIEADVPAGFKPGGDLSKIPEYDRRGLVKADENKLTRDYVKANFEPLSSYTSRCIYAHVFFTFAAVFLAFPKTIVRMIDSIVNSNDPSDPTHYYSNVVD